MSNSACRWSLAAILVAALVVRLAAGFWWQNRLPEGKTFAFPDSESYWELGRTIAQGKPYEFGPERLAVFRTPGYPALLAGLFVLAGDEPPVWMARALSAVLGTFTVGAVAWLARLLFDQRAALLAAAMAAVYPEAIAASVFVLSEAPFTPLMIMQLVFSALASKSPTAAGQGGWSLAAGVAAGLATLMRPSWLLFTPLAVLVQLVADRWTRNANEGTLDGRLRSATAYQSLATGGLVMGALCATMLPWWIRNYAVTGRFVPTSLQVGASLYDGLNPKATGASEMSYVAGFIAEQHAADEAARAAGQLLPGTFETRLDQRMRDAAIVWSRQNPWKVLELVAVKFARLWNVWPNAAEFGSWKLRAVVALTYAPVLALGLLGAWRFSARGWPYVLCWLPAVYFTLLHVVFVSSIRYRQPAMLGLIVLAAGVLAAFAVNRRTPVPGGGH